MTAIGLILTLLSLVVIWLSEENHVSADTLQVAAASLVIGALLVLAGLITWVWRTLP